MSDPRELRRRFARAGHRVSYARQNVLYLLGQQEGLFTADALVAQAAQGHPRAGRATVFRILALLEGLGLVERVHACAGCTHYLVCTETAPHHHLICVACQTVRTVVDDRLEEEIQRAVDAAGFGTAGHVVQLFGRCRRCRSTSAVGPVSDGSAGDPLPAETESP